MLSTIRIALLDLDGTLYRGSTLIPGADEFVMRLRARQIEPVFFTNNSTRTPEQVAYHLSRLGIEATAREVCTSAQAAASLVAQDAGFGRDVVYIGMDGVREALQALGLHPVHVRDIRSQEGARPAAAVLGLQTDLTYADLAAFCHCVSQLGRFILTNGDLKLPVDQGYWPGNGAVGQLVTAVTGVQPTVAGKPEVSFIEYALARYGRNREEAVMIGDNPMTDIAAGLAAGLYSIRVLSGVVGQENEVRGQANAQAVFDSVADIDL